MTEQMNISRKELDELLKKAAALDVVKQKQRDTWQRRNASLMVYRQKAIAAGIEVSDEEIDEYLEMAPKKNRR